MIREGSGFNTPDSKFLNYSGRFDQTTTRGNGTLELGEVFKRDEIDFGAALEHLRIHREGGAAGSQFNGRIFENPADTEVLLRKLLSEQLQYDQFGRAEVTIEVSGSPEPLGWAGVKSLEEIKKLSPEAVVESKPRVGGGVPAVEEGIEGAWYPEMGRNPKTGKFEILRDEQGGVKNPKGKFEPNANIVSLPARVAETNKVTVIIQKDTKTGKPTVLTIFPGENAPAFPAKIDTDAYKASTLGDTKEARFWKEHAFIQQA